LLRASILSALSDNGRKLLLWRRPVFDGVDPRYKRVPWTVIVINGAMFLTEMIARQLADSQALKAAPAVLHAAIRHTALSRKRSGIQTPIGSKWRPQPSQRSDMRGSENSLTKTTPRCAIAAGYPTPTRLFKVTVTRWLATTSRRRRRSNADSRSVKSLCSWIHKKISALSSVDGFSNYRSRLVEQLERTRLLSWCAPALQYRQCGAPS